MIFIAVGPKVAIRAFAVLIVLIQSDIMARAALVEPPGLLHSLAQTEHTAPGLVLFCVCCGLVLGCAPTSYLTAKNKLLVAGLCELTRLPSLLTMAVRTANWRTVGLIYLVVDGTFLSGMLAGAKWRRWQSLRQSMAQHGALCGVRI